MTDTLTVASAAHTAIRITDPAVDPTASAETQATHVINGANHPDSINGVCLTEGVDAGLFHRWLDHAKRTGMALAGLVYEVKADEPAPNAEPQLSGASNEPGTDPVVRDAPAADETAKDAHPEG